MSALITEQLTLAQTSRFAYQKTNLNFNEEITRSSQITIDAALKSPSVSNARLPSVLLFVSAFSTFTCILRWAYIWVSISRLSIKLLNEHHFFSYNCIATNSTLCGILALKEQLLARARQFVWFITTVALKPPSWFLTTFNFL